MSFLIVLKLIRSTFIIIALILCIGFSYKIVYHKLSTSRLTLQKQQRLTSIRETFQQISAPYSASTNKSDIEEFRGIFPIQQHQLKHILLVNLLVNRTLLVESLKDCKALETLKLINVTFKPNAPADFDERVHLPNLRQYTLHTMTKSGSGDEYIVEDDVQSMHKYREWELFRTLIPFTTMGFQEARQSQSTISKSMQNRSQNSDWSAQRIEGQNQNGTDVHEYSIDDFNWLVVSSRTDLNIRIGAINLFTVIHSQGLLLSFLTFNQALLYQIQQPNQFELKHLYLLDDSSSISVDTIPTGLITLFSYKLYQQPGAPGRKIGHPSRPTHSPLQLWSRHQIQSHFEIKISQLRKLQELRVFLHPNVKWFDLHSVTPTVRHLAISNAILTNHFHVRFLFVQHLALDVYLIDDETIVDQLPSIFPYCRRVVLDFSSINSEVYERKILTQVLQLPKVQWIVVRFYQIRRFKIWTESWEIELFLDKLGIGAESDSFLITRNLSKPNEWKGIDLTFDQVRVLTGQLSADADDFIISQAGL